ncbi:hypothetical protein L1987_10726 [Smallanthus sonchifolius]|uniref:Uncharacterized protein n=1 Tax=Smallanthus sonchifolius TaxID=185202 RepID=A0ACB9JB28_9ASTR|nr:hypothetical protein L1987_10726 [Smallanthus sonchifolius]
MAAWRVWGLPLENVGEIEHEEYYTEVFVGKQFILLDLFAFLELRTFPQETMVPMNSCNTLHHYSAFWGLMLPVSVSLMGSDVLRGYWAQRLLWEIGGYVVFILLLYTDMKSF